MRLFNRLVYSRVYDIASSSGFRTSAGRARFLSAHRRPSDGLYRTYVHFYYY